MRKMMTGNCKWQFKLPSLARNNLLRTFELKGLLQSSDVATLLDSFWLQFVASLSARKITSLLIIAPRMARVCSFLFAFALFVCLSSATTGVIELDEVSWSRIVDGAKPVLVAFTEYSWKDPEDYAKVSEDLKESGVIVAKVDTSKGELKAQHNIEKFPTIKFYPRGDATPLVYKGNEKHTEIVDWVRLQLSPKLQELKALASKFVSDSAQRASTISKAEKIVSELPATDKDYGSYYVNAMKKIQEKGDDFVEKEKERLNGLLSNKATTDKKKSEFGLRLNILNSFATQVHA